MLKIISDINWFIDMWYHYHRLTKRISRIRYYRRHRKIKPEYISLLQAYKNAFKTYIGLFKRTTKIDREAEWRSQTNELYERYKEKKYISKEPIYDFIPNLERINVVKKDNQYEYPVGKTITHVRWIKDDYGKYYSKNRIYKVIEVKEHRNGFLFVKFNTNCNDWSCRFFFENYERNYEDFELIYDNQIA